MRMEGGTNWLQDPVQWRFIGFFQTIPPLDSVLNQSNLTPNP